jgi:hypothetical protein
MAGTDAAMSNSAPTGNSLFSSEEEEPFFVLFPFLARYLAFLLVLLDFETTILRFKTT